MNNIVTRRLATALAKHVKQARAPDATIGDPANPYMHRWYLVPRNRVCNVYLHHIMRDDDARALHDHPWHSVSLLLTGHLTDVGPSALQNLTDGALVYRSATTAHRLLVTEGPVWTLFITGPIVRAWGFHCSNGWRHWRTYTSSTNSGVEGRGCE